MLISVLSGNVKCTPTEVNGFTELGELITSNNYALATFKNNYRNLDNFEQTKAIGFDFDEELSLENAIKICQPYKHIIATTKSHGIEKHGVVADRFRIIFLLSDVIDNTDVYNWTWETTKKLFPKVDEACKDASRQFYKSYEIVSVKRQGLYIDPVLVEPVQELNLVKNDQKEQNLVNYPLGKLSLKTCQFLIQGATKGERHVNLYKAARDAHQQGYAQTWFEQQVDRMVETTGDKAFVDANSRTTINDAFTKNPKHDPRIQLSAFKLLTVSDLMHVELKLDWLVDRFLSVGGISLLAGQPKSGKSTLTRQLARSVARGDEFLGRNVKKGPVLYLALEEQIQMLQSDIKKMGITSDDDISFHVGPPRSEQPLEELKDLVLERSPALVIVDTMALLGKFKSLENYQDVNPILARFRDIARDTGTHILLLHHTRKPSIMFPRKGEEKGRVVLTGVNGVLGSTAISGAVDTVVVLEVDENERRFFTSQGRGVKNFRHELKFDETNLSYSASLPIPIEEF